MTSEFGSREAGKKGGKAAAKRLTPEQRAERARRAAESRWGPILKATHDGEIPIGEARIPCAVLEDGTRVLTQQGVLLAIGRARSAKGGQGASQGVDKLPAFLAAKNLRPFIDNDLQTSTKAIRFRSTSGVLAYGYTAELLPKVCNVYLKAREHRPAVLRGRQLDVAHQCEIIVRGLANVGITALVDEATGYEKVKEQFELAKILEAFVAKEIQGWVKTFDPEFYELICHVSGKPLALAHKRPKYFGRITNNLVYSRLAPGVLQELEDLNPANESGNRPRKHHQHLTREMGHPKLKEHLAGVTTAMKMAKQFGLNWKEFLKALDKTHPKYKPMPLLERQDE
ncbi:MAG: P63C domain-containing protein [Planctomycetota bacterium]